jgi:hypothetical protein
VCARDLLAHLAHDEMRVRTLRFKQPGDEVAMSSLAKRAAEMRSRACASVASDMSRPRTGASAKRSVSSSALLPEPEPQPRSATRRAAISGTPASRSCAARVRSATNFI